MYKKFKLNRTKIKGAISCQSEGGQVSLVFSVLYQMAFLDLDFQINTFSILLGPNYPKKVKKLQKKFIPLHLWPLIFAFTTFMAFFGLFISF